MNKHVEDLLIICSILCLLPSLSLGFSTQVQSIEEKLWRGQLGIIIFRGIRSIQ